MWFESLSRLKCKIDYHAGNQGQKPNTLTRRPGDIPPKGEAEEYPQIVQITENINKNYSESW
jgi:hypothetical protein